MTVAELIAKLKKFDQDKEVVVFSEAYYDCSTLTGPDHVQEIRWFPANTTAVAITKEKHVG